MAAGLAAVVVTLWTCRYVPFQDLPNHIQVLALDSRLRGGHEAAFLAAAPGATFGYSLVVETARLLGPLFGIAAVVRLLCIASALGMPLASLGLARACVTKTESDAFPAIWAALLALPLAISWPLRIGLLPYAVALPFVVLGLASAIWTAHDGRRRTVVALAACAVTTYLAHPYGFVWLVILAGGAALVLLRAAATKKAWLRIGTGLAVVGPLLGHDLLRHRLSMVPGADATLLRSPTWWRPLPEALGHIVTRGLGATDRVALAYYEPFLAVLVVSCAIAWRRRREAKLRPSMRALVAAALLGTLGTVAVPESNENVFLLGSRAAVLGLLCWAVVAAPVIAAGGVPWRAAAVVSVTLALVFQYREVAGRAAVLADVLGPQGPERVDGTYLPVQVARCEVASSVRWGDYDPLRHVWAYALGPGGVTPYLFAGSRYQPVWFRAGVLGDPLYGPNEHLLTDNELWRDPPECDAVMQDRLAAAATWPGAYDGVIAAGRQPELDRAIERSGLTVERKLAPGIYVLQRAPVGAALHVDFGTLAGAASIKSGFYGFEIVEGRTAQWSHGESSVLRFDLSEVSGDYLLRVRAASPPASSMSVEVNHVDCGTLSVATSMSDSAMYVPRTALRAGHNEIRLAYDHTFRPSERWHRSDSRDLAVLFDELWLEPVAADLHLALGTLEGRMVLYSGFSHGGRIDGRRAVWSDGASSEIVFSLGADPAAYTMTLRAKGRGTQGVTVQWNDAFESRLTIPPSWTDLSVSVPSGVVLPGRNVVRFTYDSPSRPADEEGGSDTRLLAVAYEKLAIEPVGPDVRFDFGTPQGRRFLRGGWSVDENIGDRRAVWSIGPSSDLEVPFEPALASAARDGSTTAELGFSARSFEGFAPQRVEVTVNGAVVGDVLVGKAFEPHSLAIPREALRSGPNLVRWRYSRVASPNDFAPGVVDTRPLSVAFAEFWLR